MRAVGSGVFDERCTRFLGSNASYIDVYARHTSYTLRLHHVLLS